MGLSKKVGALLGKKQQSEDATFGEPLNLGQIAVINGADSPTDTLVQNAHVNSPLMTDNSSKDSQAPTRTSILDLEFMAAPLAEIQAIKAKTENAEQTHASAPPPPPLNSDTSLAQVALKQSGSVAPITSQTPLPNPYGNPNSTPEIASHQADVAIAHAVRGNKTRGYIIFDNTGRVVETSQKFVDLLTLAQETSPTFANYDDLLDHMAKIANLGEKDVPLLKARERQKMREQLMRADYKRYSWATTMKCGKILEFSNSYTPNHHLVTLVEDVTEKIEKARLLKASLDLGTAGYWSYCFTTGKSTLSDYILEKLSASELIQVEENGLLSIIHPEDVVEVDKAFKKAVSERSRMDCQFRIRLEGGDELVMRMIGETEMSPSSDEPAVFIAFLNDLTEDTGRARELDAIKELSRNKSEFLARMSHEIKTPLNAIVGMTDALRDEVETDEARETASFIADAAENLNTILSQTLEHERLATTDIILDEDIVDLGEVLRSVCAMWRKPCADKGLILDVRIADTLPEGIKLDSSRLRQCVTNLLSNAVKFSDSGKIVLAAAPLLSKSAESKFVIAVRDNGIGMSPEAKENIFKPFKQGNATIHKRFGGSGLGMSITQHIVNAMDGHIKVQSEEGKGTTIALTLPLKLANAIDTAPARPVTQALRVLPETPLVKEDIQTHALPAQTFHPAVETTQKRSLTASGADEGSTDQKDSHIRKNVAIEPSDYSGFDVLVVEDNPINQAVVKKLLTNHINSMTFAFHGEEALDILESQSFDVILMDIHMPVKDGIETTLEIRNSGKPWADTVIVALTADPDYQQKRVCRNIGMNDALSKPVRRQELLDILQKVLDERNFQQSADAVASVA